MTVERIATVLAVDDVATSVVLWSVLLNMPPIFQDGTRWAQFDVAGGRIVLACAGEAPHGSGVLLKVADLDAVHEGLAVQRFAPGPIETGAHERRFAFITPGAAVTFYQPL